MAMIAAGALTLLSSTVTSVGGTVPMPILALLLATGFAIRFGGLTAAIHDGRAAMGWGTRVTSWFPLGAASALLGLAGSIATVAGFGAFVVLDAVAGVAKSEATTEVRPKRQARFQARKVILPTVVVLYLAGVVAFQIFIAAFLPYGTLLSWTLLSLGFSLLVMVSVRGPKADDAALHPPTEHRRHTRRETQVEDPERRRVIDALGAFRARGDAAGFLTFIRQAAQDADLPEADTEALEASILASFSRAGTNRDADVRAALERVEEVLSLRRRPLEP